METWKPVVGYEGLYEVSDEGRVNSLPRQAWNGKGFRILPGGIRKTSLKMGYSALVLNKDGKKANHAIHVLVARAFLGPTPLGKEVAHSDGVPSNNRLSNLSYKTPRENQADRKIHGTYTYGEIHNRAKLTGQDIDDIEVLRSLGARQISIAREFGLSHQHVSDILSRKRWSHLPL